MNTPVLFRRKIPESEARSVAARTIVLGESASRSAVDFAAKPAASFKPPLSRHRQAEFHIDYD